MSEPDSAGSPRVELDLIDQHGTVAERFVLGEGDEFTSELLTDKWTIRCRSLHAGNDHD